jgi:hypothetical protein
LLYSIAVLESFISLRGEPNLRACSNQQHRPVLSTASVQPWEVGDIEMNGNNPYKCVALLG